MNRINAIHEFEIIDGSVVNKLTATTHEELSRIIENYGLFNDLDRNYKLEADYSFLKKDKNGEIVNYSFYKIEYHL